MLAIPGISSVHIVIVFITIIFIMTAFATYQRRLKFNLYAFQILFLIPRFFSFYLRF